MFTLPMMFLSDSNCGDVVLCWDTGGTSRWSCCPSFDLPGKCSHWMGDYTPSSVGDELNVDLCICNREWNVRQDSSIYTRLQLVFIYLQIGCFQFNIIYLQLEWVQFNIIYLQLGWVQFNIIYLQFGWVQCKIFTVIDFGKNMVFLIWCQVHAAISTIYCIFFKTIYRLSLSVSPWMAQ